MIDYMYGLKYIWIFNVRYNFSILFYKLLVGQITIKLNILYFII